MAFADTQELAIRLSLKDNFSKGLASATRNLNAFDKATGRTQKSLSTFGRNLERGAAIGLVATAGAFTAVVKAAADYESAFAGVRKTVTATEPELQKLSDAFRKLAREIPISAAELARLGEAGGALGIATKDLEEFVRVTALLGVTTDLTSDDAANSLGILSNVLHLTSAEYSQLASSLVALGNAGASTESQIIGIAERVGATGELIGLSTQQVLGFSSAVASLGIEVEAGGSALQKFFIDTTKFAAEGGEELALMAKIAGTSGRQFAKVLDEDAGAALQRFLAGLGKLEQAAQLGVLEDLGFNDVRITRTLLGLANNTTLVAQQMDVANSAFLENTALTKEAEQRFKTFDSQLQITKNVLTDIGITIGSKLLPKLTPLLKRLNEFVNANQGKIEEFGTKLADGFEKFATAIGKVDWQPFIDGLQITGQIAKEAIGLFMSLPPDVQKIAIAALAVNKVTGGLGSSIIKDLAGLALGQLRTVTAANVTVVGGTVGAAGAAGATGKSTAGKVVSAATKVFLVGAAVGVFAELKGILDSQGAANRAGIEGQKGQNEVFIKGANVEQIKASLAGLVALDAQLQRDLTPEAIAYQINMDGVRDALEARIRELQAEVARASLSETAGGRAALALAERLKLAMTSGFGLVKTATDSGALRAATASNAAGAAVSSAVERKNLSVTTINQNTVNVSYRDQVRVTQTHNSIYKPGQARPA